MNPESVHKLITSAVLQRQDCICYGLLPLSGVMFVYGDYGTYKSWIAMDIAYSISEGIDWMGLATTQRKVLLLNTELPNDENQRRWIAYMRNKQSNGNLMTATDIDIRLDLTQGRGELAHWIAQLKLDVVIIDNLYTVMAGDITNNNAAKAMIEGCKWISKQFNTAFIIIHHARESEYDQVMHQVVKRNAYEMFGSKLFSWWADTVVETDHYKEDEDEISITFQKTRLASAKPLRTVWQFNRSQPGFSIA